MLLNTMLWHSDLQHANSGARDLVFILNIFPFRRSLEATCLCHVGMSTLRSVPLLKFNHDQPTLCEEGLAANNSAAKSDITFSKVKLLISVDWHLEFLRVAFDLYSALGHRGTSWTTMSRGLRWRWSQWKVIPCLQSCCVAELDKPNCTKLYQIRQTYKARISYIFICMTHHVSWL